MLPKGSNSRLTSSSLCCFPSIPTNNFLSSARPENKPVRKILSSHFSWGKEELSVAKNGSSMDVYASTREQYWLQTWTGRYERGRSECMFLIIKRSDHFAEFTWSNVNIWVRVCDGWSLFIKTIMRSTMYMYSIYVCECVCACVCECVSHLLSPRCLLVLLG